MISVRKFKCEKRFGAIEILIALNMPVIFLDSSKGFCPFFFYKTKTHSAYFWWFIVDDKGKTKTGKRI